MYARMKRCDTPAQLLGLTLLLLRLLVMTVLAPPGVVIGDAITDNGGGERYSTVELRGLMQ